MPTSVLRLLVLSALFAGSLSIHAQSTPDLPAAPGPAPLVVPKSTGLIPVYSSKAPDTPALPATPRDEESWCTSMKDSGYFADNLSTLNGKRAGAIYMREAIQRIRSNWRVPRAVNDPWVRGASVLIRFKIEQDGTVLNPAITVSSGRRDYDARALASIRSSSPLAPMPEGLEAPFKICFRFAYNEQPARTEHLLDSPKPKPPATQP